MLRIRSPRLHHSMAARGKRGMARLGVAGHGQEWQSGRGPAWQGLARQSFKTTPAAPSLVLPRLRLRPEQFIKSPVECLT
jgi:hypothetical protein